MSKVSPIPSGEAMFDVRATEIADIPAMALVLERANAQRDSNPLPDHVGADHYRLKEIEERLDRPGAWSYIAVRGAAIAGFVLGHPSSEEETVATNPTTDYLAILATEPNYWQRGVGGLLLRSAAETARANNKDHLLLWTGKPNMTARRLYERHGYQQTELMRTSISQVPLVQYLLDLRATPEAPPPPKKGAWEKYRDGEGPYPWHLV